MRQRLGTLLLLAGLAQPTVSSAAQGCGISGLLQALDPYTRGLVSGLLSLNCTAAGQPIAFGNFDPITSTPVLSNGNVQVTCQFSLLSGSVSLPPILVCYSIALTKGGGSYAQRQMASGARSFGYNIYTDATYGSVWGDSTSGTTVVSDSFLLSLGSTTRTYTTFGRITTPQAPVPATGYADTIGVTVSGF